MKKIVKTPIATPDNDMTLSMPATVHIELTSSCCFNCRHCYNFWRKEKTRSIFMSQIQLDAILDELLRNNIMHVIFTGGEPFLNNAILLHGIKRLKEAGASVSCNSTLAAANSIAQLEKMRKAGLGHILTSLNSHRPDVDDYIVSVRGAHRRITEGITNAVSAGIRISVNMIISALNIKDIYDTAGLASRLGAKKFFGTRVVPNIARDAAEQKEFLVSAVAAKYILDELLRVEEDFHMQVGTLVPFPFCFIMDNGDWAKYKNFYSHGCPAGNKMISLNANGDAHACVHEKDTYGNILKIGVKGVWENMKKWRDGTFFPDECKECLIFDECNGGCRLCALAYKGKMEATDNLRSGYKRDAAGNVSDKYGDLKLDALKCSVPEGLRFRKENGFCVIDRFGSEILCVKSDVAGILENRQKRREPFSPHEAGLTDADLVRKLLNERVLVL